MEHYQSLQQSIFIRALPAIVEEININFFINYFRSFANSYSPSGSPNISHCFSRSPYSTFFYTAWPNPIREDRPSNPPPFSSPTTPSPSPSTAARGDAGPRSSLSKYFILNGWQTSGFATTHAHLNRWESTQPALGIDHEHLLDEGEEVLRVTERNAVELALLDLLGKGEVVAGLKGPPQGGQLVDQAPSRPDVRLFIVLPVTHLFRRHVVGRAHVGLRELRVLPHLPAETEIAQLYVVALVDEDIGGFYVAVQHLTAPPTLIRSAGVAVLECEKQLVADLPDDFLLDLRLGLFRLAELSAQVPAGTVLHDDVDPGGGLVDHPVHVPHDIGVVQLLEQVDLSDELLLLTTAHLLEVDLLPHQRLPALLRTHLPHHPERTLPDLLQRNVLLHLNYQNNCYQTDQISLRQGLIVCQYFHIVISLPATSISFPMV